MKRRLPSRNQHDPIHLARNQKRATRAALPLMRTLLLAAALVLLLVSSLTWMDGRAARAEGPSDPARPVEPRALVEGNMIGVIPGPDGCPAGIEEVNQTHQVEHDGTRLSGWTGAVQKVYGTHFLKLHWTFCLIDADRFKPLLVDYDGNGAYAVYRPVGHHCPEGSHAVDRHFDSENGWDDIRNLRNLTLSFCFFPPTANDMQDAFMSAFPQLPFEYGVFAAEGYFVPGTSFGRVHSDDENENNSNYYQPGNHDHYDPQPPLTAEHRTMFHQIVHGRDDTVLELAQVYEPPEDGDPEQCNGDDYCAANPRKIDLTVSLHRDVIATEQISYTNIFMHFADAIYEMSEGVHRLRNINVCDDGDALNAANVRWVARGHPATSLSGYWNTNSGKNVYVLMADVFSRTTDLDFLDSANWIDAGYTLGHEWGHYYYGMEDEYEDGKDKNKCDLRKTPNTGDTCLGDVPVPNSVMNSQWNASPPTSDLNYLNFSVGASQTFTNAQYRVYRASGWEVLARSPISDPRHAVRTAHTPRHHFPELDAVEPISPALAAIQLSAADGPDNARAYLKVNWNSAVCNDLVDTTLSSDGKSATSSNNEIDVLVDNSMDAFDVTVDHDAPLGSPVKVVVRDPAAQVAVEQDCTATDHVPTRCTARVEEPAPGAWTADIVADEPPVEIVYQVIGYDTTTGSAPIQADISVLPGDVVLYPSPVLVTAKVWQDLPIARATLMASLEEPGGSTAPLTLRDDGRAPDHKADDGEYSGYVPYSQNGHHRIRVLFSNSQGTAVYSDLGMEDSAHQLTPVNQNFQRVVETSVVVSDVIRDDHGNSPTAATSLNVGNADLPGQIDYAADADVFVLQSSVEESVVVRIAELGQGMLPNVRILDSDGTTLLHSLVYTPGTHTYPHAAVDLKPNQPVYIEVTHQDGGASQGFYFVSAGKTLGSDAPPPAAPAAGGFNLEADGGSKNIELQWAVTSDPNVTHYRVLRSLDGGQSFQPIADNVAETTYYDNEAALTVGSEYCYRVEALRGDGSTSAASNDACALFGRLELWVPDTVGAPGETVIVPINVRNADGLRIAASDVWMDFDPRVLQSVSISRTALTEDYAWAHSVQSIDADTRRVRIAYIHSDLNQLPPELHGDGSLFWLTFQVQGEDGDTSLLDLKEFIQGVGGSSIQQETLQDVALSLTGGLFTVKGEGNASYILGDVDADTVVRALDAALALRMANGERTPTNLELLAGDVNANAEIDSPDASMILYYAGNGQWPPVGETARSADADAARTTTVRLDDAFGAPGATVQTTLRAENLYRAAGGRFVLVYDPDVVARVVAVQQTDLTADFAQLQFHEEGNGLLSISLVDDGEIGGSGALLTISLQLAPDAAAGSTMLRLAQAKLNDLNGRDFITGYADHTLERQSATITVEQQSAGSLYLPSVQQ